MRGGGDHFGIHNDAKEEPFIDTLLRYQRPPAIIAFLGLLLAIFQFSVPQQNPTLALAPSGMIA